MKYPGRAAGLWRTSGLNFEIGRLNVANLPGSPQTSDVTSDMIIAANGKVGIGTAAPLGPLSVGDSNVDGSDGYLVIGKRDGGGTRHFRLGFDKDFNFTIGDYGSLNVAGTWASPFAIAWAAPSKSLYISSNGAVGIGSITPEATLQIIGQNQNPGNGTLILGPTTQSNLRLGYDEGYSWIQSHGSKPLAINPLGNNVGIGTTAPQAPLHVGISGRAPHSVADQFAYVGYQWNSNRGNDFQWGLSDRGQPQYFDDTSILTEGRVVCKSLNAFSDARIKTNLRPSKRSDALKLLNQLKVTDYQLKDSLAHGPQYHQGFVAQEVERVFPQAVSQRSDFIPDIYSLAEETAVDQGVLTARLQDPHNLAEGDMVRLITETEGVKEVPVTVVDERTFAVKDWTASPGKLFVHGRKVDDFRTLDYQQIFSLGISGIQQLSIEVSELKAANARLRKRLQLLESKPATAPSLPAAARSSKGNGRHAPTKVRTRRSSTNGKTKR
jgi:hypothetical protein